MEVHQRIRRVCRTSNIQEVDHKKEARRLARALKIFKIVCQAELQPRHYPPPPPLLPLPRQNLSRANGVTGSCGTRCATWREERERERGGRREERVDGRGRPRRRRRRRSRAHVSNLKYVGVVWMGLADASRRPNMFTPFVRSTPV